MLNGEISFGDDEKIDWYAFHETLRQRIKIEDILVKLGVMMSRSSGGNFHVLCPLHNDISPSMYVYVNENNVRCYGACKKNFDVIGLWAAAQSLEYIEAADQLGNMYSISPVDATQSPPVQVSVIMGRRKKNMIGKLPELLDMGRAMKYHRRLTEEHRTWLREERLIPDWLQDEAKIGYKNRWPPAYVIPVLGESVNDLIGMRFRRDDAGIEQWSEPILEDQKIFASMKYWGLKGKNYVVPFGLWRLDGRGDVLTICEGEMDTLALIAMGIPAITLTNGTHVELWKAWERFLEPYEKWVIAFDNDEEGGRAAEGVKALFPSKARRISWPIEDGWKGKDITDFLLQFGYDEFAKLVEEAACGEEEEQAKVKKCFWRGWNVFTEPEWIEERGQDEENIGGAILAEGRYSRP